MKKILYEQINNSKKNFIPLNNTISCYHRPHINYFKSINNQNRNKIINKTIKINLNKTQKIKLNKYHPEIESKLISFYKINNSFEKIKNNSENFNHNFFSNTINRPKSFVNINNKKIFISNPKNKNINYIKKNNNKKNYLYNSLFLKYNNKSSISKDIAILCKIINSINYTHNKKLIRNKNNKSDNINPIKNINIYHLYDKNIIIIQRWWRKMLYHLYIEKYILIIQHQFRKYNKKKKNFFNNKNILNIKKIIIIQKAWRKYIKSKCLHNYYFFSFKKYINPKKENKINNNISSLNLIGNIAKNNSKLSQIIYFKDNNYITKIYYKMNQINDNIQKIQKIQRVIKKFLHNKKNLYKKINFYKTNSLMQMPCYITKDKKYISFIINNTLISKIIKIQKSIRNYLSSKFMKSDFIYNPEEGHLFSFNNKEIIRKKFSSYISLKLSQFFLLILKRIKVFYFIKIINQRIKKNVNQNIFFKLFNREKKEMNSYPFFFQTIWRVLKININTKNEVSFLLINTIPKFFSDKFSQKYIPYITPNQENKIINTQLFKNNDDELINYIFYFIEKDRNININKKYIKNHLNEYNLKNRNIFFITRYIDSLYKDLIQKKMKINEIKENIDINEEYLQTQENTNDLKNIQIYNEINTNFIINRTNSYCAKNFRYKFIDYLNKNSEFLKKQ